MKKLFSALLAGAIVVGLMGAGPAVGKKKKKPKPKPKLVPVEAKYFFRDADGCDTNVNQLSLEDGEDTGCWYLDAGAPTDAALATPFYSRDLFEQLFVASDGVPFKLDATKPLTAEIYTSGGTCLVGKITPPAGPAVEPPCSPAQVKAGEVSMEVTVRGTTGGSVVDLGTVTDTFTVTPADPTHKSEVSIPLDAAMNKKDFSTLEVGILMGGKSVLNGIVEMDDPTSILNVPTLVLKKK